MSSVEVQIQDDGLVGVDSDERRAGILGPSWILVTAEARPSH